MMENKLDNNTPDPGTLWLAIGIGVFSVLASFVLAIYYSTASQVGTGQASPAEANAATQAVEAPLEAGVEG